MNSPGLRCPFCNAQESHPKPYPAGRWSVQCSHCGATGPVTDTAAQAIEHWRQARLALISANEDLRRAHEAIEARERSYAYAMDAAGDGLWDWDIPRNQVSHNLKWCELLGLPATAQQHGVNAFIERLHEEDRDAVVATVEQALRGSGIYHHEHRMRRSDGSEIWVIDRGKVVERDTQGRPVRMTGCISDISLRKQGEIALLEARQALLEANARLEQKVAERTAELARANEDLRRLALRDALTGLHNRLAANERLHEEFLRMQRSGKPYAVLLIDIDHFKKINDSWGHAAGDEVLRHIAGIFRNSVRESDFIARFGGEEFFVLLPESGSDSAQIVGERIRTAVESGNPPIPDRITVSIGLAMADASHEHEGVAVLEADLGLYEAKRRGRNRLVNARHAGQ